MMLNIYLYATAVVFIFFALIWRKDTGFNISIKLLMIVLSIVGGILSLQAMGVVLIK